MARWPKYGQPELTAERRFVAANDWFVSRLKTDGPICRQNGASLRKTTGSPAIEVVRPELTFDSAEFWPLAYRAFAAA
jgi:hypothetical protein